MPGPLIAGGMRFASKKVIKKMNELHKSQGKSRIKRFIDKYVDKNPFDKIK